MRRALDAMASLESASPASARVEAPPSDVTTVIKPRGGGARAVSVLCTGGTLTMRPDRDGALAPAEGFLAGRMAAMPEFRAPEMPAIELVELRPLVDSSDMGPADWSRVAAAIEARYDAADGFVVVMGTDTMAYAASALSFMLEGLGKPVVLTGSMLPLSTLFNDAARNLIVAAVVAGSLPVPEVCVFMDAQLMRGNRTVKSNSAGLDAFESVNFPALAKLETGLRFRPHLVSPRPPPGTAFRVHHALETNIAVWRMVPGFEDEYIQVAVREAAGLRAIVLELYGTGNLSARKASLVRALEAAVARGVAVVATSQCLRGAVDLRAYALGRRLDAIGVLSAYDMTTEAVVAKLAYLLSFPDCDRATLKHYMARSLRGEVTEALSLGGADGSAGGGIGGVPVVPGAPIAGAAAGFGALSGRRAALDHGAGGREGDRVLPLSNLSWLTEGEPAPAPPARPPPAPPSAPAAGLAVDGGAAATAPAVPLTAPFSVAQSAARSPARSRTADVGGAGAVDVEASPARPLRTAGDGPARLTPARAAGGGGARAGAAAGVAGAASPAAVAAVGAADTLRLSLARLREALVAPAATPRAAALAAGAGSSPRPPP